MSQEREKTVYLKPYLDFRGPEKPFKPGSRRIWDRLRVWVRRRYRAAKRAMGGMFEMMH